MTLRDYLAQYGTTRDVGAGTLRQYRISVELLEEHVGHEIRIDELDEVVVSDWLRALGDTRKPATVRSKRAGILALWRAAADDGLRGLPRRVWWPLAIRLAWDTGLRWGDLVQLRTIDIDDDVVAVVQRKTRRPHVARLRPSTVEALRESLDACPRDLAVPWPCSQETFTDQVRALVARAGIRRGTWKWLRRGGATDVEVANPGRGDAARHLGHRPGSPIAHTNYIDARVVAATVPIVAPRDLGRCDAGNDSACA